MRCFLAVYLMLLTLPGWAAEKVFSFSHLPVDQLPSGFQSIVLGQGNPGEWKTILDQPLAESPGTSSSSTGQVVLAQVSRQALNNRHPVLLGDEVYSDFRLTTRFKIVDGILEQSAGMVFRYQNESNYYLIRADALAKSFRCYKVENGVVKPPLGPEIPISRGAWHTLVIQCEGTRILCGLDGQDHIKLIDNNTRKTGRLGYWTKSDSVVSFADTQLNYVPHELLAQVLIRTAFEQYPRLLDLQIFASRTPGAAPALIAARDSKLLGQPGGNAESDVIAAGKTYYGKSKESVSVTMPLRDRNGDPIAAVRVTMKTFPGQTEDNAIVRAQPVVKGMQARVQSLDELLE